MDVQVVSHQQAPDDGPPQTPSHVGLPGGGAAPKKSRLLGLDAANPSVAGASKISRTASARNGTDSFMMLSVVACCSDVRVEPL
eukprot:scaffold2556_cov425-Prasinococcus_capsulatus_cf.AAC.10